MVIVESTLSHWGFSRQFAHNHGFDVDKHTLGLAKAGAVLFFVYFWLKILGVAAENAWSELNSGLGYWFMVEIFVFVLLPSFLFLVAAREGRVGLARFASLVAIIGIVINRVNVSIVAFNWQMETYVPKWTEVMVTITLVTVLILAFRWIVNRMPILKDHPDYPAEH